MLLIAPLLVSLAAVPQDPEKVRLNGADTLERIVRSQGLPRKFDGSMKVGKVISENQAQEYAARTAGENTAVLVAGRSGRIWILAGGTGTRDGLTVNLVPPLQGIALAVGGKAGKEGAAGAGRVNGTGGVSLGDESVGVAHSGSGDRLVPRTVGSTDDRSIGDEVIALSAGWDKASEEERRARISAFAGKRRPSQGAAAFFSPDGRFLVFLGADGTEEAPDGTSLEITGRAAATMILAPGRKGGDGKAGSAKGPKEAYIYLPE